MWEAALELLKPPQSDDYIHAQQYRLLHTMLIWAFVAALISSVVNIALGDLRAATILVVLAAVCMAGLLLSQWQQHRLAATIFCVAIFAGVTLEAFFGGGIHDAGIVAYAVLILCATFLFGNRWGLVLGTSSSIAAVLTLWQAQNLGLVQTTFPATIWRVIVLAAIFVAMAGVTRVVRSTWDDNVAGLIESYDKTLRGWALALEYRDGETAGHCQRVVGLSVDLAKKLGCGAEEVKAIRRGAYLHDIGKMAIPDEILKKPGPLTAEERTIIQQHPDLGREFVGDIPFLAPAVEIMYAHHERWDGLGYPRGLKGSEIPLGARIFSIVDQWDALHSDRPYRDAWPKADIVHYIDENSGTMFDPRVADAFLHLLDEVG